MIMCGISGGTICAHVHGSLLNTFCATFNVTLCATLLHAISLFFCAIINDSFECDADTEHSDCILIAKTSVTRKNLDYLQMLTKTHFMFKTNMPHKLIREISFFWLAAIHSEVWMHLNSDKKLRPLKIKPFRFSLSIKAKIAAEILLQPKLFA